MSETTSKTLKMTFGNANGNKNISLPDPLDTLDAETVVGTMNEVVALETMIDSEGNLLDLVVGAEIETVTTQVLF